MNFALIMFVLLVLTGSVWLLDKYVLRRRRDGGFLAAANAGAAAARGAAYGSGEELRGSKGQEAGPGAANLAEFATMNEGRSFLT
jgi:hypothetical protein